MTELPPAPPSPKPPKGEAEATPGPALFGQGRSQSDSTGSWMVTFTDLVALLLTFFVMIFAMSTVKIADWQSLTQSLRERLNSVVGREVASPTLRLDVPSPERAPGTDLDYLAELLRGQLAETPELDGATLRRAEDRVYLSFPADLLFQSGAYTLTEPAARAVFEVGGVLRNITNLIAVAGHADPRQPRSRYASNWELSLLRAQSVAAALREAGVTGSIRARGFGDSRFDDLPADLTAGDRLALARRVDLVIHDVAREPVE
jgi:chemotaxis protein MotB